MGQTNKTIEVNGKRYDAVTGAIVSDLRPGPKPASSVHVGHRGGGPRAIDGFTRISRDESLQPAPHRAAAPKPKPAVHHTAAAVSAPHKAHSPASHTARHQPQRATTLMRTAVKKPAIKSASVIKAQTRTDLLAQKPNHTVAPKLSYGSINKLRHQRAERMVKSPVVAHFSQPAPSAFGASQFAPRPAAPAPVSHTQTAKPQPVHQPHHSAGNALDFVATSHKNVPAHTSHHAVTEARHDSEDIFAQALANATSHEQVFDDKMPRSRKRKRVISFAAVSVVALLAIGFFSYKNAPQISLQVASYRSGVHAKLPAYQPSDFAFDKLEYSPGNVTANYVSSTNNEKYSVSQRASNWDSQALLSNVVTSVKQNYKTYERAGRTVYVLSNDTATWVDSGILYTVEGNSSLTSAQLLDLASSM